jgi:hypothetical protein
MAKPTKLKVLGFTYDILYVHRDDSGGDKLGWCDFANLHIYVTEGQPKDALANTFLHEVIHSVNYSMGIESGDEENLTNRLANGLCAVWKENPDAMRWWSSLLKDAPAPKKKVRRRKK